MDRQRFFDHKNSIYIAATLVSLVAFLIYLPALQNGFVNWDDGVYVYKNAALSSPDLRFIKWAFTTFNAANYHPLTWISYAMDYSIWGINPFGYHLTNILIHTLNTFLVVFLTARVIQLRRTLHEQTSITKQEALITAGITGILFGIHPLHVESVAWIAERKDVLCAFFFLLSILSYTQYVEILSKEDIKLKLSSRYYLASFGFFLLALLSKPMAITLPAVMLILDWHPFGRYKEKHEMKPVILEKLPFFILSLILSIITVIAQHQGGTISSTAISPLSTRFLVASKAVVFYLWKMLWPSNLIPFYAYPADVHLLKLGYLPPVLLVLIISTACLILSKRHKIFLAVWGYYIVTLLPVLGIVQVGPQAMADRYTYLPIIGPTLLLCLGFFRITGRLISGSRAKKPLMFFSALIISGFIVIISFVTISQIKIWNNSITLWNRELEIQPNPQSYNSRGHAYYTKGNFTKAIEDYTSAIQIEPRHYPSYSARGITYLMLERYTEAAADFDMALSIEPTYNEALYYKSLAQRKLQSKMPQ